MVGNTVNPFQVVKDFEAAIAAYCGAPYCVSVNSCTNALFACLMWQKYKDRTAILNDTAFIPYIEIPKRTYIGVAQAILNAGYLIKFRNEDWSGSYDLYPYKISDSAKRFTSKGMYETGWKVCTSHHWNKTLGIMQGGCILHDDEEFDVWARKFRFDGRTEGIAASNDLNPIRGHHMYLSPEIAAAGLVRLHHLPRDNPDMPMDNYPDLSQMEIFKNA